MFDKSYDMHLTFYGDRVDVETVDYTVTIEIPEDCGIEELANLLHIAMQSLIVLVTAAKCKGEV